MILLQEKIHNTPLKKYMTLFYMIQTRKIHDQKNTYRAKKYITPEKYMNARKSTYVLSAGFANPRRPHPHSPATPLNNHSVNRTQSPTTPSKTPIHSFPQPLTPSPTASRIAVMKATQGLRAVGKVFCDGRRCVDVLFFCWSIPKMYFRCESNCSSR